MSPGSTPRFLLASPPSRVSLHGGSPEPFPFPRKPFQIPGLPHFLGNRRPFRRKAHETTRRFFRTERRSRVPGSSATRCRRDAVGRVFSSRWRRSGYPKRSIQPDQDQSGAPAAPDEAPWRLLSSHPSTHRRAKPQDTHNFAPGKRDTRSPRTGFLRPTLREDRAVGPIVLADGKFDKECVNNSGTIVFIMCGAACSSVATASSTRRHGQRHRAVLDEY